MPSASAVFMLITSLISSLLDRQIGRSGAEDFIYVAARTKMQIGKIGPYTVVPRRRGPDSTQFSLAPPDASNKWQALSAKRNLTVEPGPRVVVGGTLATSRPACKMQRDADAISSSAGASSVTSAPLSKTSLAKPSAKRNLPGPRRAPTSVGSVPADHWHALPAVP